MYIAEKYWGGFIGGSDDSLTLVEYLAGKQKEEVPLGEIFSDFGLDKLHGEFREPEIPLVYEDSEGWEAPICYAIGLIADLAALLLECRVNGSVDLNRLFFGEEEEDSLDTSVPVVTITASPEEHRQVNQALMDFAKDPFSYDLSEMETEEGMLEMAALCEELRKELYGG